MNSSNVSDMKRATIHILLMVMLSACRPSSSTAPAQSWEELPVVAERTEVNGHPLVVCHPEKLTDSIRIPLSQLVEDLDIIRLENKDEAYVRNTSIRVSDNYILLHSSRNMPFKLFDRQGKFVCNIGSVSSLPGGYSQIYDFQLDEAHNRIYLMPWNATELTVYDLQGRLQPSIPLNSPDEKLWKLPKSVFHVDGDKQEVTVFTLPWENNPRMVWVQDFQGRVLKEQPPTLFNFARTYSYEIYHNYNTPHFDFSLLDFAPQKEDTLYHYESATNRLLPVFTLDFPEGKMQIHDHQELPTCFIGTLVGRMEDIGLTSSETRDHIDFIVDKRTLRGGRYMVYNDFWGNIPVYWLDHSRHGYYARNLSPAMLKEELEAALRRSDLTPSMRQKVSHLVESIDVERDNNYLMIGKLKQLTP